MIFFAFAPSLRFSFLSFSDTYMILYFFPFFFFFFFSELSSHLISHIFPRLNLCHTFSFLHSARTMYASILTIC